ncbi:hypothetical protein PMEL_200277 [Prevotella melaninogenica]|uniref:Uncharacterized protein n=1 Tax=Prevotella melaninogenica TaxID=28132 RepID=A0A250KIK8_9BACT|nr:hypothetical protein PMEL_200277 [Prevotella melaninogenica]
MQFRIISLRISQLLGICFYRSHLLPQYLFHFFNFAFEMNIKAFILSNTINEELSLELT